MYFDNNFYVTLRNCDLYIFHNELFYSKNIFPITEDFLIKITMMIIFVMILINVFNPIYLIRFLNY